MCAFMRQGAEGRRYVLSHITQKHPPDNSVLRQCQSSNLICDRCGQPAKSKAGLSSHMRSKHPEDVINNPRNPIKTIIPETPQQTIATSQPGQHLHQSQSNVSNDLTCPACGRTCASRAGLKSHMRGIQCRGHLESGNIGYDERQ